MARTRLPLPGARPFRTYRTRHGAVRPSRPRAPAPHRHARLSDARLPDCAGDRQSVVEGKSVSVRVDLGGSCIIKKHTHSYTTSAQSHSTTSYTPTPRIR